jgi:thymidylate synthase ThyX
VTAETFTPDEQAILERYFSNFERPVFALTELPDIVKGALFARYSRTPKSLRRLFLDEFYGEGSASTAKTEVGLKRAEDLYGRVFLEYGDDSVAQLVSAHVAVEGASNILTKVLERGRLMAYLEQSTRYVPYNDKPGGRWRYHVPAELGGTNFEAAFIAAADRAFELYSSLLEPLQEYLRGETPKPPDVSASAYRLSVRAKACDVLRGLLPAATASNVGIYGSAQAFEGLILRLLSHPLAEARQTGEAILGELKRMLPTFMERVERADRGGVWARYLRETSEAVTEAVAGHVGAEEAHAPSVSLTEFEPEGETKVCAAILYEYTGLADEAALVAARALSDGERRQLIETYTGTRANRRHKPGRAFERTSYRFDVVADYGAFRDLQRHRLLTIEWQDLTPHLGFDLPAEIGAIGAERPWRDVMETGASLYESIRGAGLSLVGQYVVPMAYNIRFCMEMNAREALHVIELRTSEQAHRNYRRVCQEMLRLVDDEAGHGAIAAAMSFAGAGDAVLGRLASEQRNEERRTAPQRS